MVASRLATSAQGFSDPLIALAGQLAELRTQVDELSCRTLQNAMISSGGLSITNGGELTVLHPSGDWLLRVSEGAQGKYFLSIHRDDGTTAFEIGTTPAGNQFWGLWDRTGHVVASDDATSGVGLARPWLNIPMTDVVATAIPTTTSASYLSVQSSGWILKQQPYMEVQALLIGNSGGAGNAQVTVNGAAVGDPMPIAAGSFGWTGIQKIAVPGNYDSYVRIELQVQLTNGTGNVGGVLIATGRQS